MVASKWLMVEKIPQHPNCKRICLSKWRSYYKTGKNQCNKRKKFTKLDVYSYLCTNSSIFPPSTNLSFPSYDARIRDVLPASPLYDVGSSTQQIPASSSIHVEDGVTSVPSLEGVLFEFQTTRMHGFTNKNAFKEVLCDAQNEPMRAIANVSMNYSNHHLHDTAVLIARKKFISKLLQQRLLT